MCREMRQNFRGVCTYEWDMSDEWDMASQSRSPRNIQWLYTYTHISSCQMAACQRHGVMSDGGMSDGDCDAFGVSAHMNEICQVNETWNESWSDEWDMRTWLVSFICQMAACEGMRHDQMNETWSDEWDMSLNETWSDEWDVSLHIWMRDVRWMRDGMSHDQMNETWDEWDTSDEWVMCLNETRIHECDMCLNETLIHEWVMCLNETLIQRLIHLTCRPLTWRHVSDMTPCLTINRSHPISDPSDMTPCLIHWYLNVIRLTWLWMRHGVTVTLSAEYSVIIHITHTFQPLL